MLPEQAPINEERPAIKLHQREVEERMRELESVLLQEPTIDIRSYQHEQQREQAREAKQGLTLGQRLLSYVGYTPERRFTNSLSSARQVYAALDQRVTEFYERLEQQDQEVERQVERYKQAQDYFVLCKKFFEQERGELDRLEAQIETLEEDGIHEASDDIYHLERAKRMKLQSVREARTKTNRAKSVYQAAIKRKDSLKQLHVLNEERYQVLDAQRQDFFIEIEQAANEHEFAVRHDQDSARALYEESKISTQELHERMSQALGSVPDLGLDGAYKIRESDGVTDPLIQEWLRIRDQ